MHIILHVNVTEHIRESKHCILFYFFGRCAAYSRVLPLKQRCSVENTTLQICRTVFIQFCVIKREREREKNIYFYQHTNDTNLILNVYTVYIYSYLVPMMFSQCKEPKYQTISHCNKNCYICAFLSSGYLHTRHCVVTYKYKMYWMCCSGTCMQYTE